MASILPPPPPQAAAPAPAAESVHALLPELQTTTHLLTLPVHPRAPVFAPQNTHFLVHITHLRDSLAVWVGAAPRRVVEGAQARARARSTKKNESAEDGDALDRELADALRQAGRLDDDDEGLAASAAQPCGALAVDWAVTMTQPHPSDPSKRTAPLATSLFRTNADIAQPMGQRLAVRLAQTQLFLALDLPPSLVSHATTMTPAPPERSATLLLLERGISDAVRAGIKTVQERRAKGLAR